MTQAGRDGSHDGGTYGSAVAAEGWQRVAGRTDLQPITERMLDLAGVGSAIAFWTSQPERGSRH